MRKHMMDCFDTMNSGHFMAVQSFGWRLFQEVALSTYTGSSINVLCKARVMSANPTIV